MELDLENPLTNSHLEKVSSLFFTEVDHMPSLNYLKSFKATEFYISFRQQVISSILQVSCNFNVPFLSYLSINYLDRFLLTQGLPEPKPWVYRLIAVSCVSLAAKMMKADFSLSHIQEDGGFIFDAQTIQRMEELILGALKWRMRSITPLSFISFFISLSKLKDPPLVQALKARAIEIILKAQTDIKLLEFKPSVIAASALLSAVGQLFPSQFSCLKKSLCLCSYVNKEKMLQCYNMVQAITLQQCQSAFDAVLSSDMPVNGRHQ